MSYSLAWRWPAANRMACLGLLLCLLCAGAFAEPDSLPVLPTAVNVNSADAHTMAEVLEGVGLTRAQAIVAYREQHGVIHNEQQLQEVKGIGARTLARNAGRIRFSD